MSIIKRVTLQKIVAHDFRYGPRTRISALQRREMTGEPTDSVNDCLRRLAMLLLRCGKCRKVNNYERYSTVREFRTDETSGTEQHA